MKTYKQHYYDVVMDLDGREFLKAEADREDAVLQRTAPSASDDKRRFLEAERAEIVKSSDHPLTRELALSGFVLDDRFFAQAERMARLDGMDDDGLRAWHWGTAYRIGLIDFSLSLLVEDAPIWDGIATDLSTYISEATDKTLSFIIQRHRLPAGVEKPRWIGRTQDAGRFAKVFGLKPAEFNGCFCGVKIDSNTFKPAKGMDGRREHELYAIAAKYKEI